MDCKRPTLLPATLHVVLRGGGKGGKGGQPVEFAVLTEGRDKEVLVGRLSSI